jgi:hypothetical protein
MPNADENRQREDLENQVWNAIAAFEQIVETIPTDRVSLEALSSAYEQVGDLTRAREYLVRLVDAIISDKDYDAADLVHERLLRYAATDPKAKEAETRLDTLLMSGKPAPREFDLSVEPRDVEVRKLDDAERRSAHVAAELSLAWVLFQAKELTQEDYASVAQDLSEVSASKATVTVSVLHVLHDRANRNLERVLAFVCKDSRVPIIPLSLFDVPDAAFSLLPLDFMVRYGVMVFELMGNEALAIVLNPYNKTLRALVTQTVNKTCHFYLTTPADFDTVIERNKVKLKAQEAALASAAAAAATAASPAIPTP